MKTTRRGFFARLGGVLAAVVVPWRVYKFHVDAHGDRPKTYWPTNIYYSEGDLVSAPDKYGVNRPIFVSVNGKELVQNRDYHLSGSTITIRGRDQFGNEVEA